MKRKIALLLAAAMVLSSGLTAYASETGAGDRSKQKNVRQETAESHVDQRDGAQAGSSLSAEELARQVQAGNVGQVDVVIGNVLAMQNSVNFTVKLTDALGAEKTGRLELEGNQAGEKRISFEGLQKGEYTLQVAGDGFVTYRQNLSVEDRASTVKLMTGYLEGISYEDGTAHPGVLLLGDVNMDGGMDAADRNAIVDSVHSGVTSGMSDLNRDGSTNLLDLEYFAHSYEEVAVQAWIEKSVPAAVITPRAGDGTKVEGDLGDLLRSQGSVALSREDGQKISRETPVVMEFDFAAVGNSAAADGIIIETDPENPVTEAQIVLSYVDGNVDGSVTIPVQPEVQYLLERGEVRAELDDKGNIRIHLGGQIAVKKVTFTITGVLNNNNLAEISKVEFVNGMEERIPEPEMNIPEKLDAKAGNASISLSWDPCVNVTGYEVLIRHGDIQETLLTSKNALNISSFGGKKLTNYLTYQVSVQSVNGTWTSGYCDEVDATPKPTGKPDKPDNVSAVGKYKSVVVSWKNMKDTLTYNLYYKESTAGEYQKIEKIENNSYTITDLKDLTEYTVYVTGVNEFGESGASLPAAAMTTGLDPAQMPKYNLINTGEKGEKGAHIVSASMSGEMRESAMDTQTGTAWGTVDHDPSSYYYKGTWDDGGFNPMSLSHGLTFEFDQAYKMDTIAFLEALPQDTDYGYAKVRYWNEDGTEGNVAGVSVQKKNDASGRPYYVLKFSEPVEAKKIQFGLARSVAVGNISVSEVYFYYYDELWDEILSLYEDDLHTILRADVTQAVIDALRVKIQTVDPVSGEYNPDRELLERELATAETILKDGGLNAAASVKIHSGITTNDVGRGFGGLNAWQPLGVTAAAGEEIMVYVGHNTKKTGDKTDLKLIATQYHAEAAAMSREVAALKVGANKITIPKVWTTTGYESGGALYVQYGGSGSDQYAVRVSGGVQVPRLDLYQVTGDERLTRVENYVKALESYVTGMNSLHETEHKNSGNAQVAYDYDQANCILGASDILLDTMMLSLPAGQILGGAGTGDTQQKAQTILNSMDAMEDMMHLFYQHKGLSASAVNAVDQIPKGHLNIRYQRMFSGAFMYASGNHIGIEWGSAPGMVNSVPVQSDSEGRYQSGRYFGWGIAHEIGHCINQGSYAIAEITNNYFAVLAQAKDNNGSVRFQYKNVYDKVTSGAKGAASNVFTQLGMYWQLHLAYDRGYNYKTYADHKEQLAGLFFARVDSYSRTPANAPSPGGVPLNLSGADKEQALMRLACAAAERNILDFFVRWGKTPDAETRKYAEQFAEETRAIYYVSDESRVYSLNGGTSKLGTEGKVEAVGSVTAAADAQNPHLVNLTMSASGISEADILGYEIVRCSISGGRTVRETAGFTTGNAFTDTVPMNNRVVWYEITLIDQYLNRSAVKVSDSLKIGDDGSLDKGAFTVETVNLKVEGEADSTENEEPSCSAGEEELKDQADGSDGYKVRGKAQLVDNAVNTVYTATAGGESEIILNLGNTRTVSGLKYTHGESAVAAVECTIQVRSGGEWKTVASDTLGADTSIVYFTNDDGKYIAVYETDAVKLVLKTANGSQVSIAELDVLGPTGDNVEFRKAGEGTVAIGRLTADYTYAEGQTIPKDSIVFTGSYKGSPAYNVLILYDQAGNIVGGLNADGELKAQQIILADPPEEGNLGNVSEGTWIYWIEPEQNLDLTGLQKVRAELYRVNNALTNEGQRLVSDSLFETVPSQLPGISFDSSAGGSGTNTGGSAGGEGSGSNTSGSADTSGTTGSNAGGGSTNSSGTTGSNAGGGSADNSGAAGSNISGSANSSGTTDSNAGGGSADNSGAAGSNTSGSANSSGETMGIKE